MQIDHVMISVPNYSETLEWYQEKFDATIEKEWTVDELPDLQLAYLNVHGFRIEVVGTGLLNPVRECQICQISVKLCEQLV
jgi:methylmalonyl-CoA/ethylmalonyl-CoA epimerase